MTGTLERRPLPGRGAALHRPPGVLSLRDVSKDFAIGKTTLRVLEHIDLEIGAGEFVVIVGASGCGKSTLLRLLAGLDTEFSGQVMHGNEPVHGTDLRRGLVFQDHRLFPWLTVSQNIELAFSNTRVPADERKRRVRAQLAQVGLAEFEHAYPQQLSGGMSQRAAMARALVTRPEVLLLDEPLGALDALTRLKMQVELRRLWQEHGTTMVMVTHDIDEAVFLADRVVVLDARPGRIRRIQPVELPQPRKRSDPAFTAIRDALLADFVEAP